MIKVILDNEILDSILKIEKNKDAINLVDIPIFLSNRFRKNTKKRSSYASNKMEGNPLTFDQASEILEAQERHFLKPEQEIRNYYLALTFLEERLSEREPFSIEMLLEVQKLICFGEPKEKIGIRKAMPPGVLFAVWNQQTHQPEYIPPEYSEVLDLLKELVEYIKASTDHPVLKAAVLHYQLVTIHPFEDGNGRTARILSNYVLSYYGYGFKDIGSLEEYFAYDIDEYYTCLQMGLPALYYDGRNNPPHPEIWIKYFLKVFSLYANKVLQIVNKEVKEDKQVRISRLSSKSKNFLLYLRKNKMDNFTPIDLSKKLGVTNRTIINWCTELSNNGFLKPILVNSRIRHYEVIKENE
ncbi:MAG: Fic family protein [Roseburia sp.]|nr:Fic family protein [Anaeroplasma bactoclasticum]MCM1195587.1 Fic family protein [Roseburia sp.]MCM1556177.1 Fic family protein [Anaeroplasma bactoclasticum]